jgi:hypothetical protein
MEFQQDLMEFIKHNMEAGDVSLPEVAIALWDEIHRIEEMVREASEEVDDDAAAGDRSESDDGEGPVAGLSGQPSTDDGEDGDDGDADATAESDLPEDPAFR